MLTGIKIRNFKSYKEANFPLAPLTVLIGANASGKSNAIEALRMLSWLAQGKKLSSIAYESQKGEGLIRGQNLDFPYRSIGEFGLGCLTTFKDWDELYLNVKKRGEDFHISEESISGKLSKEKLYILDNPSTGQGSDAGVAYNNFTKGSNKPRITCNDQMAIFTQLSSPASFGAQYKLSQKIIPETVKLYEQALSKILFLDPVPARMRDYSYAIESQILGDGSNLSGILHKLWGSEKEKNEKHFKNNRSDILSFIQSLPEQEILNLSFLQEPKGKVMVSLTESFGGEKRDYDASLLSDGTLRVLAISAAMLSAPEGGIVVIEEIDNGVHPNRAKHLLEKIKDIAERRSLRVVLSTHNPALLDALPDDAIPNVVFCYRDPKDGSSRLSRLEEITDYPELMAQGSLGHLVTSGTLERFVKQERGSENRKKQSLDWLRNLRSEGEK